MPLAYKPCNPGAVVGRFSLLIQPPMPDAPGFAQVTGGVHDRVDPHEAWQDLSRDGGCKVITLPPFVCSPPCAGGNPVCAGQDRCVPEPVLQDLGPVTMTGLPSPLVALSATSKSYYAPFPGPYPPFPPEAEIRLAVAGGPYGAFSLAGRGIEPLRFPEARMEVIRNRPLSVSWAPGQPGSARILVVLDIAHHGGIGARVECDVADTGSVTIAGTLINALIEQGTAGCPSISVTRRTVDSTTIAPGCVEFAVASDVQQPVEVEGVISCCDNSTCPAGLSCQTDLTCR
jgi:hypothetical protein